MTRLFVILGIIVGCATFGVLLGWLSTRSKSGSENAAEAGRVSGLREVLDVILSGLFFGFFS